MTRCPGRELPPAWTGHERDAGLPEGKDASEAEKAVRRIMSEECLIVPVKRRRGCSSCRGETAPAPGSLLQRGFRARAPNLKWLTDLTGFRIPAGAVCLSPVTGCFGGMAVSWTMGTSPNAGLVNEMPGLATGTLKPDERPVIHSDRGRRCRWPGWIERAGKAGLVRFMSRKGCSPDNSACEGFFGRLKNGMFYGRPRHDVSADGLMEALEAYIRWYSEARIKMPPGGMSPLEYRKSLGLAA